MERLSIDTVGPFPADEDGNIAVIVIIDNFSRFVTLHRAKDMGSLSATTAILEHLGYFGPPFVIQTDKGSQFFNSVMKELTTLTGIDYYQSVPYSHEENGIVERSIKEFLRHLRTILFEKETFEIWSRILPLVQRIMNATKHSRLLCPPSKIVFGNSIDLDRVIFHGRSDHEDFTVSDWQREMLDHQARLIAQVQKLLVTQDDAHKNKRRRKDTPDSFPEGTYVLVTYVTGRAPNKLVTPTKGPYKVVDCTDSHVTIQDLITGKTRVVHIRNCKAYNFNTSQVTPADLRNVARRDYQEHTVEKIMRHRLMGVKTGKKPTKTNYEFRVRWLGYTPSDDTWGKWEDLRNTLPLHKYLDSNGLTHLIPPEHKRDDYDIDFDDLE
jgi:hypothetical protein